MLNDFHAQKSPVLKSIMMLSGVQWRDVTKEGVNGQLQVAVIGSTLSIRRHDAGIGLRIHVQVDAGLLLQVHAELKQNQLRQYHQDSLQEQRRFKDGAYFVLVTRTVSRKGTTVPKR